MMSRRVAEAISCTMTTISHDSQREESVHKNEQANPKLRPLQRVDVLIVVAQTQRADRISTRIK